MNYWNQAAASNRRRAKLRALFGRQCRPKRPPRSPNAVSHYRLLKEIGAGARGTVYLARDQRSHRLVALKLLRWHAGRDSRQRFLREAACASAIAHPNVVGVYEVVDDGELLAIAMEYVPGKTLNRAIPKRGLPLKICCDYAVQIAEAVAAVHSAKVMHRDLKPANFVVRRDGRVKLLDFSLAKIIARRRGSARDRRLNVPKTREGTIQGTPDYMSPEQVLGQATDQRSDVFSLGSLFFAMLTGRPPFHEKSESETMNAILRRALPKLPARIPAPIRRIVRRCLTKKPASRYQSASEVLEALVQAIKTLW